MNIQSNPVPEFGINGISMTMSSFNFADGMRGTALAPGGGKIDLKSMVLQTDSETEGTFSAELTVSVDGMRDEAILWSATVRYRGDFKHTAESKIPRADAITVYAPAYLYAYAREHLSDMVRRSDLGVVRFPPLPPMNFQAQSGQKETAEDST